MEDNIDITLEDKLSQSEEKYLRLYSDFENYRKRVSKEKEDLINHTRVKMLSSILDVDSDISIAIRSINDEDSKKGMLLIYSKIENFLKSHGIESVQTDVYEDGIHEVISIIGDGDKIIDVINKGYTLNGDIFRYPKVILGK